MSYVVIKVEGEKVIGKKRAEVLVVWKVVQLRYIIDVYRKECGREDTSLSNSSIYDEKIVRIYFNIKLTL